MIYKTIKIGGFMKKKKMYYLTRDVVSIINQEMWYNQVMIRDGLETMKAQKVIDEEQSLLEFRYNRFYISKL